MVANLVSKGDFSNAFVFRSMTPSLIVLVSDICRFLCFFHFMILAIFRVSNNQNYSGVPSKYSQEFCLDSNYDYSILFAFLYMTLYLTLVFK